jgi:hypothetical protein
MRRSWRGCRATGGHSPWGDCRSPVAPFSVARELTATAAWYFMCHIKNGATRIVMRSTDTTMNAALEADAAYLEAMGQDPGPTLEDLEIERPPRICDACGGDGGWEVVDGPDHVHGGAVTHWRECTVLWRKRWKPRGCQMLDSFNAASGRQALPPSLLAKRFSMASCTSAVTARAVQSRAIPSKWRRNSPVAALALASAVAALTRHSAALSIWGQRAGCARVPETRVNHFHERDSSERRSPHSCLRLMTSARCSMSVLHVNLVSREIRAHAHV